MLPSEIHRSMKGCDIRGDMAAAAGSGRDTCILQLPGRSPISLHDATSSFVRRYQFRPWPHPWCHRFRPQHRLRPCVIDAALSIIGAALGVVESALSITGIWPDRTSSGWLSAILSVHSPPSGLYRQGWFSGGLLPCDSRPGPGGLCSMRLVTRRPFRPWCIQQSHTPDPTTWTLVPFDVLS